MERSIDAEKFDPAAICFGLDRKTDEVSLYAFLRMFTTPVMLNSLIPRLSSDDIDLTVNFLTGLMKKYLREDEYHRLFLQEE